MKRILTLALSLLLILGALTGCANNTELHRYSEDALKADPGQFALDAYSPDTVVMKIDGSEVHWNEYVFWLCSTAKDFAAEADVPVIPDWNAVYDASSGETYAEALCRVVLEKEKQFHVLEAKAAEYGAELGEEGNAYVESSLQESMESFSITSEEERDEVLRRAYLDEDVLRYQAKVAYLYLGLYQTMFGADGEKISEEEINDYVAENGYMTVKHILLSTVNENNEPLPEDDVQRKLERAQRMIERLNEIEDPQERLAQFDRYMSDYNEDPGVLNYPNGYCFKPGEMEESFEQAAAALAPYQVTAQPVQTVYGYHVILRLPTTGEDVIDITDEGLPYHLREDAAQTTYLQLMQAWIDDAEIEWQPGFEHLDIQKLFTKEETGLEKLDVFHWFH